MAFNSCKNKENCPFRGVCSDLIRKCLKYDEHENINICILYFRTKYREHQARTLTVANKELIKNGEVPNVFRVDSVGQYLLDFGTD